MGEPFFSILLPTRNRSEIVGIVLQSYLRQTFSDFEVVVSDNDETEGATRDAVAKFTDPRIRYFRTNGRFAMHENYENALTHARGRYVLALEDKLHLVPTALEVLHQVCREHPHSIISYPFNLASGDTLEASATPGPIRRFSSEEAVEEFCRFSAVCFDIFPRGLTSCAPRALMEEARRRSPTGLVFSWVNPDYSQAFQLLSVADELLYLKHPIIFVPNSVARTGKYSNGLASIRKQEQARRFFESLPIKTTDMTDDVPVKSHWLYLNPLIYDFRKFYRRPGHNPEIDWVRYHAQCMILVVTAMMWKADMGPEIREIRRSLAEHGFVFTVRVLAVFGWRAARAAALRIVNRIRH